MNPTRLTAVMRHDKNPPVIANSVAGIGVPNTIGAQAPIHDVGAIFMPASSGAHARQFMAGGAGEPQGSPDLSPVRQSRVARHLANGAGVAGSSTQGIQS